MKTPEEYELEVSRLWVKYDSGEIDTNEWTNGVADLFKQAQKDAYNQAIDDAVENASCEYERDYLTGNVDKESILKLKK